MQDFDVIIIGGGPAGLVASKLLTALGKKTALIEANKLGGDCTWSGCVPSKTLLQSAKALHESKGLEHYGLSYVSPLEVNTDAVFSHVREVISKIYAHETPEVFEEAGVHVISGYATFVDAHSVKVGDTHYKAKHFIIATGTHADVPAIKGIESVSYLTNENLFALKSVPESIIIVGTGAIAIEMATAFNHLGSKVTLISRHEGILRKDDEELTDMLLTYMQEEGITFVPSASLTKIEEGVRLTLTQKGVEKTLQAKQILFATGRVPNTKLDLEKAGVSYDAKGINVNETLQTSASHIYAIGDVATPYKFTHIAEYEAILASQNIALPISKKADYSHVGWCTYAHPELAHIGLTEKEAKETYGKEVHVYRHYYKDTDRGYTDGKDKGMVKVIVTPKGKILGAHILGERAGELIHQLQLAKSKDISFDELSKMIYLYPTFADMLKQPSKKFYIAKLQNNPFLKFIKAVIGKKK